MVYYQFFSIIVLIKTLYSDAERFYAPYRVKIES